MEPAEMLEVVASSRLQAIREAAAAGDSDVQRFYCGRVVFVTGGSGFLGKQLVEKLLRTSKISKVYLLLRSKKGKNIKKRLDDIVKETVYDNLREQQPNFVEKIIAINGDVSKIRLGINDEDWTTLTKEVDMIFHAAATTRFDEPLHAAAITNLRGTRECLRFGKACQKLCAFVHVSTAYTHATMSMSGEEVYEKFYKCPIPPDALISMAEDMDEQRLSSFASDLIKDWPNTYSFTKAVTEEMIRTTSDGLPICIVRPGIVISSLCEPSPGWLDTSAIYSASGVLTGIGLGVIHTVPADVNVSIGIIPCDYVNNTIIVAGRETALKQTKGGNETKIYSMTPTYRNPVTWYAIGKVIRNNCRKIPSPLAIYYAFLIETKSKLLFSILTLLLHIIPSLIADIVCVVIGKERRFLKGAKKVYNMCNAMSYFWHKEWKLVDTNTAALYENLSRKDKIIYNFDVTDINWKDYIIIWCLGIRKYLVKDGLKNTQYAIKKNKVFEVLHYILMPLYAYSLWKFVYLVLNGVTLVLYS